MIGHGRDMEATFSFRERGKGNDLVSGEAVQGGPGFHILKELFGHVPPYEFSGPPQGACLIRPQANSLAEIGE
jgi:hypothetical protein